MALFNQEIQSTEIPELTPEIWQDIYWIFKTLKIKIEDISEVFKRQKELSKNYHFCYFEDVSNEVLALINIARTSMMRENAPTSEIELIWELQSDILNIDILVKDFMDYTLNYKENTTRAEFEEQFIFLKTQNEDFI